MTVTALNAFNNAPTQQEVSELLTQLLLQNNNPLSAPRLQVILALNHLSQQSLDQDSLKPFLMSIDENQIVNVIQQVHRYIQQHKFFKFEESDQFIYVSYSAKNRYQDVNFLLYNPKTYEFSSLDVDLKETLDSAYPLENDLIAIHQMTQDGSNSHLAQQVDDAIDVWLTVTDPNDEHFWEYFPAISLVSVSFGLFSLFQHYKKGDITWQDFQWRAVKLSGLKVSKIAFIGVLLSLPVAGQITGTYLIMQLLLNAKNSWFDRPMQWYKKQQSISTDPQHKPPV